MPTAQMSPVIHYQNAMTMNAIAMVRLPEIGKVSDRLCMIEAVVPQPKAKEVAIELKASSMHVDEIYAAQGTGLGRLYGPQYIFVAKPPQSTIRAAMRHVTEHNITMPIERELAFDLVQVRDAVQLLTSHRTRGRVVINFQKIAENEYVDTDLSESVPL